MRTLADRIRHTLLFELVALVISAPVAALISGHSVIETGVLAIFLSVLAMSWNLLYNWLFDLMEDRYLMAKARTLKIRIVHAVGFELGLLIPGLFIVTWWLNMSLAAAFLMDFGFMLFFMLYALVFNWSYDQIFPMNTAQAIRLS